MKREIQIDTQEQMCDLMCRPDEHEYCLRCGRKLKNPDARLIGYGTTCLKKLEQSFDKNKRLF